MPPRDDGAFSFRLTDGDPYDGRRNVVDCEVSTTVSSWRATVSGAASWTAPPPLWLRGSCSVAVSFLEWASPTSLGYRCLVSQHSLRPIKKARCVRGRRQHRRVRTGAGGQGMVHVTGQWLHDSMHSHTELETPLISSVVYAPCAMGRNDKRERPTTARETATGNSARKQKSAKRCRVVCLNTEAIKRAGHNESRRLYCSRQDSRVASRVIVTACTVKAKLTVLRYKVSPFGTAEAPI